MKFRLRGLVTISVSTVVDAATEGEAKEIAETRPLQSLCHQCSSADDSIEWATSGELDGTVFDVTAELAR